MVKVDRVLTWRFWAVRILPVGFFMALTLLFGNIVYLYLTVAFIQMLKVRLSWLCMVPKLALLLFGSVVRLYHTPLLLVSCSLWAGLAYTLGLSVAITAAAMHVASILR